jgi:hypothetical protein
MIFICYYFSNMLLRIRNECVGNNKLEDYNANAGQLQVKSISTVFGNTQLYYFKLSTH